MSQRVVVIHPDLGVGGAERLIIDASKALQDHGHTVDIYTAYHDKTRCFLETKDGTLRVTTIGQWIPRTMFGGFHALMAYMKMIYIAIYLIIFSIRYDLLLCDQVSACIPILKFRDHLFRRSSKIVFYCHFPDQLLTTRKSLLKTIYRLPIDKFEEWSTGLANVILVNSKFTSNVVRKTFKSLRDRHLQVLYPCVDVEGYQRYKPSSTECNKFKRKYKNLTEAKFILLSLNRYERKKDLGLAIKEFSRLKNQFSVEEFKECQLIIAGGYDKRLDDCVQYYRELEMQVSLHRLQNNVTFLKSPSDQEKLILLQACNALIYTPQNEHFGIVPIEAMAMKKPVIACASGGPLETIENNVSGFLCEPELFEQPMLKLAKSAELCKTMGEAGYKNVIDRFSYETFSLKLNEICFGASASLSHRKK